jgi:hypothetical protein
MIKEKKFIDIQFRIIKIHTVKFCFEDYSKEYIDKLFKGKDALELKIKTSQVIDKETLIVTIDINTVLRDIHEEKYLVEHTGRTSYQLKGIDNFYDEKTKAYKIPNKLQEELYQHAYEHTRALLATELRQTPFQDKYFLPVIDQQILVKKK